MTEFSVGSALDNWIEQTDEPRPWDGRYHPSSMWSCERQQVYEVRGVEPTNPKEPRNKRILRVGSRMHEILQAAIASDPRIARVYIEVPAEDTQLNISGHADALVEFFDGTWELFELKSIGQWGFKALTGPKDDHEKQARTYASVLRRVGFATADGYVPPLGDLLRSARWVYINRDDLSVAEWVMPVDSEFDAELETKVMRLDDYTDYSLPPRLPDEIKKGKPQRHWLCQSFCVFRDRCWNLDTEAEMRGLN